MYSLVFYTDYLEGMLKMGNCLKPGRYQARGFRRTRKLASGESSPNPRQMDSRVLTRRWKTWCAAGDPRVPAQMVQRTIEPAARTGISVWRPVITLGQTKHRRALRQLFVPSPGALADDRPVSPSAPASLPCGKQAPLRQVLRRQTKLQHA